MTEIVAGITTALDIVKKLRDLNKAAGEADFKMLLADLTSALGDAKLEAANLKISLAEAVSARQALEHEIAKRVAAEPQVDRGAYVFEGSDRHYCTACYDTQNRKVMVDELSGPFADLATWMCPACKATLGVGGG